MTRNLVFFIGFLLIVGCRQEGISFEPAESGQRAPDGQGDLRAVSSEIEISNRQKKSDILFVIDNSESMHDEQREIGRRIRRMLDQMQGLDWRLAIVTTDPFAGNRNGDGVPLRFPSGDYFLDADMNLDWAREQFAETIYRPEIGSGLERGIHNTYRAIERSQRPSENLKNRKLAEFFRDSASLAVVLISDENETLQDPSGLSLKSGHKSRPRRLIRKVRETWGLQKKFQWNSVIVREGDYSCLGLGERFGTIYENLSYLTGGVVANKCASDYSGALRKIGDNVVGLEKVVVLECEPQDQDGDSKVDIEVESLDGNPIPGYSIYGNQLEFDQALASGEYRFNYFCL